MKYIEMICFDNTQQEYENALEFANLEFAKGELLVRYSSDFIGAHNTTNINCSTFELNEQERHQELLNVLHFLDKQASQSNHS